MNPTVAAVLIALPQPARKPLLLEAIRSVYAQTREPDDLVIGVDYGRLGEVANMNRLIRSTSCEWLAFLHDDDLWHPDHLETAVRYMDSHDVIVADKNMVGRPDSTIEAQHSDFGDLRSTNWFPPSAVVVRADVFGEWCEPSPRFRWVDWANWNRLLDRGARMVHTNEKTFSYRFGGWSNGSWRAQ